MAIKSLASLFVRFVLNWPKLMWQPALITPAGGC